MFAKSLVLIITFVTAIPVEGKQGPNIIVFLVDDYDKPETSLRRQSLTPNLDRLAREGMICHNAHVTSTVCTPSRYTYLTGRMQAHHILRPFLRNALKAHRHSLLSMLDWNPIR